MGVAFWVESLVDKAVDIAVAVAEGRVVVAMVVAATEEVAMAEQTVVCKEVAVRAADRMGAAALVAERVGRLGAVRSSCCSSNLIGLSLNMRDWECVGPRRYSTKVKMHSRKYRGRAVHQLPWCQRWEEVEAARIQQRTTGKSAPYTPAS